MTSAGAGAPDASEPAAAARRITKLSEATINRIAAGEVVQRPSSALKELLENSIDARSTSIKVQVKEGGLKLLSIQDNGSGIKKDDLPLLCERFATSKLRSYDDLSSIATYGFRGEALASISHVAHLTVTTKTQNDPCGFKARYLDGKLVPLTSASSDAEPKPVASNDGTLLLVEDLFYNTPLRRKGLRSAADEYSRILDVVSKYAIHNAGISMTCKKSGSSSSDLSTSTTATTLDVIGQVYSEAVKREMNELAFESKEHSVHCKGYVSGANYSAKRGTFIFFINHRLVDCSPLKKNVESFYSNLLPKGGAPFVYLSLQIHPSKVDVNVSPTKSEVHFLDQDDIIEVICEELQKKLASSNQSRTFTVQTLLPGAPLASSSSQRPLPTQQPKNPTAPASERRPPPTTLKTPAQRLVRTDANAQTLDAMFGQADSGGARSVAPKKRKASDVIELGSDGENGADESIEIDAVDIDATFDDTRSKYRGEDSEEKQNVTKGAARSSRKIAQTDCDLTSIQELRQAVEDGAHAELTAILKQHTFVGVIDLATGQSMLQHRTKLYLVNHNQLAEELFYQLGLRQFGAMGRLHLKPPPSLRELLEIAMESEPDAGESGMSSDEIVDLVHETLTQRAEMLDEYFSLRIDADAGTVKSIPMVLPGWTPNLDKLPLFLLRLGVEVDWQSEKGCFSSFLREVAFFSSPEALFDEDDQAGELGTDDEDDKAEQERKRREQEWQLKHVVFPSMRYLSPPKSLVESNAAVHVASLENLYKVFERC